MADPNADPRNAGAAQPAAPDRSQFWLDLSHRFALPLVTTIIALAGTYITTRINEQNNLRDTINQREQAESALRTSMFKELVSPVVGGDGAALGDVNKPQRLALLAELLALNFHEHFDLGPLMLFVDELPDQTRLNRNRLRSVARRVISRELAVLGRPATEVKGAACATERTDADIWLISDASEPLNKTQDCDVAAGGDSRQAYFTCSSKEHEPAALEPFTVSSVDCQDRLTVLLADLDWPTNTVRVIATSTPRNSALPPGGAPNETSIPEFVEFTLSPYAMPFSDNTLLRSGNRFGIYIRQIEPSREPCEPPACDPTMRLMRLSLIWFPRDFIPPRERPTDFEAIRKSLKL